MSITDVTALLDLVPFVIKLLYFGVDFVQRLVETRTPVRQMNVCR